MSDDLYYLQCRGSYVGNSLLWWRKDGHGYTCDIKEAHAFTREEAFVRHECRPNVDIPWRKDYIDALLRHHVHADSVDFKEGTGL